MMSSYLKMLTNVKQRRKRKGNSWVMFEFKVILVYLLFQKKITSSKAKPV